MIILEYNVIASYGQTVNSTNHSCVYELLTYQLIEILKFSQRHSAHAEKGEQKYDSQILNCIIHKLR